MSSKSPDTMLPNEAERYELQAPPSYHFEANRREFFKLLGSGLLIISASHNTNAAQESGTSKRPNAHDLPVDVSSWLHIGEKGKISVFTGKAEMGQNIRTSLSQAVAEELSRQPRLILICGRYEGVDERVATHLVTDEISIGDYVLSGGELAAAVAVVLSA